MSGSTDGELLAHDVQASFCATLVDEWIRSGVTHAVVSPGSRSTPLAIALAARAELVLTVVLDERSASFVGIGIARSTGLPVVLLCTSGTAAVEYHPAVVEADLDRVPLLVCTADRPAELLRIGAPQTVIQQGLYGESVRWSFDPGVPARENMHAWRSVGARAVLEATVGPSGPGPVHLNLPFREPLVGEPLHVPRGRADGSPWHVAAQATAAGGSGDAPASTISPELCAHMSGRNGLFVVGAECGDPTLVHRVAAKLKWPVLADARSGCRTHDDTAILGADLILRDASAAEALMPDVVIRLGAPWASKVLAQWLARTDAFDVLVDPNNSWLDPNRHANVVAQCDPNEFLASIESALQTNQIAATAKGWLSKWKQVEHAVRNVLVAHLDKSEEVSEPAVARALLQVAQVAVGGSGADVGSDVVVASSMPIRDTEWFGPVSNNVCVLANRGANGIDGVVSTAVGVAVAARDASRPVFAILGDLAFLHDVSGLVSAATVGAPFTFVIVDNAGGAIFEFLPQATALPRERFETLFGTPQRVDIAALCESFGFELIRVHAMSDLRNALGSVGCGSSVSESGPGAVRVILVRTDRQANVGHHNAIYAAVGDAIRMLNLS